MLVVIIGVIGAVGISGFRFLVRRARVQSVALEIAGWIENVRNGAADSIVPSDLADPVDGGCAINFIADATLPAGSELATVDPPNCIPENRLVIPDSIRPDSVTISGLETVVFTPRGLWTDDEGSPGDGMAISITLVPVGPERCVRLTPVLGAVEIGRPLNGSTACADDAEWRTL